MFFYLALNRLKNVIPAHEEFRDNGRIMEDPSLWGLTLTGDTQTQDS